MYNIEVADILKNADKNNHKICVLLGAGASTSAGIPDFRSAGTGLYDNLKDYDLPSPESIFDINYFKINPKPFYQLRSKLFNKDFQPTKTHSFLKTLQDKGILSRIFTQNIDGLEEKAGIDPELIIYAHGSIKTSSCVDCKTKYSIEYEINKIPICEVCEGYIRPDIVFFNETLPQKFIQSVPQISKCDVLIVIGTSLSVYPFASIVDYASKDCIKILINKEKVGPFRFENGGICLLGSCDEIVNDLCDILDWK